MRGSSRRWLFAALALAACATPPLYTDSTPPTVMTTSTAAGVRDMRGTYREALCRRLAGSAYSCDGVLRRLPGESAPDPDFTYVAMSDLAGRYRVGFVLGFMAECVKGIVTPFADVLTALHAAGIDARILDAGGRGSTAENAERLAVDITSSADDARPFVIVAYSKGLPDVLELLVTRPAAAARVAAVVSVAGASNGSPLADRFRSAYDLLVAKFPLGSCRPGTGQEIDDLRRDVRLEWWRRHAADVVVPIFTLVTAPRPERVSRLMRPAYLTLARLEPRNDGNIVWYDQIPPGSRLLGYLDADHWGVATPYSEQIPIASPFFADSVPRPSIIEAALEVVSTSLTSDAW
jgi:hypothetical protein